MRPLSLSKPSKYRNRKTRMGGHLFDSKLEAERWLVLKDKEKRGKIASLVYHPSSYSLYAFEHNRNGDEPRKICVYKPDFEYFSNDKLIVEDCKGVLTPLFSLKAKIFRANYPHIELRIIKAKDITS